MDCPVGLFLFNGTLCLKTEYATKYDDGYHSDVYVCNTGEAFWGGADNVIERDRLMVMPAEQTTAGQGILNQINMPLKKHALRLCGQSDLADNFKVK